MTQADIIIRNVTLTDLGRCCEIEFVPDEGDEAATLEIIRTRIRTWPQGFIVLDYGSSANPTSI